MIAVGVWFDDEKGLAHQVSIRVTPHGITDCRQATCSRLDFDFSKIEGDVVSFDPWVHGQSAFPDHIRYVRPPVGDKRRSELVSKYLACRPAIMEAYSCQAGANAFVAAFGLDW